MDLQQLCQKLQDNKSSSTTSLHTRLSGNTLPRKRSPKQQRSPQSQKSALSGIKVKRRQCEEFPKSAYDLLRQLLDLNPSTRITAEGALHHPFITGSERQQVLKEDKTGLTESVQTDDSLEGNVSYFRYGNRSQVISKGLGF